jgi:hypothetical protein
MAGAGLFWEKSTAGWLRLVAGGWFVLREKYCWLVADKPSEQAARVTGHMFDVSAYLIKREQKIRVKYYEDSVIQNLHRRL